MNDKANKAEAIKLCNEYVDKSVKMMNDAILCISALENKDDIQECIAKVVSCFNVNIEFVIAAVNSHRNGGHACGECKRFGNKASLKCVYRGKNHPACDDFEQRGQITSSDMLRESDTVQVVTENAETEHDAVNPPHYKQVGIECKDCIKAALGEHYIGFLIGNVIKYTYRYQHKNGV